MLALPPPLSSSKAAQDSLPTSNRSGCAPPQRPLAVVIFFSFSHVMVSCQHLQCRGVREGGHTVCVWGRAASCPGRRAQVRGATQPQSPASHLDLAFWVGGFVLLPVVPSPCPLFSLLQSSFKVMRMQKVTASRLFPLKRWESAVQTAHQMLCLAFTGLGASAAAVAGVKTQA